MGETGTGTGQPQRDRYHCFLATILMYILARSTNVLCLCG